MPAAPVTPLRQDSFGDLARRGGGAPRLEHFKSTTPDRPADTQITPSGAGRLVSSSIDEIELLDYGLALRHV